MLCSAHGREFFHLFPELSNSGCLPGRAGGTPYGSSPCLDQPAAGRRYKLSAGTPDQRRHQGSRTAPGCKLKGSVSWATSARVGSTTRSQIQRRAGMSRRLPTSSASTGTGIRPRSALASTAAALPGTCESEEVNTAHLARAAFKRRPRALDFLHQSSRRCRFCGRGTKN